MVDEAEVIRALQSGVGSLSGDSRDQAAEGLAQLLLAIDTKEARNAFAGSVGELAPVQSAELIRAVLEGVVRRTVRDWPRWLDPLSDASLRSLEDGARLVTSAAERFWDLEIDPERTSSDEIRKQVMTSVSRVANLTGLDETALGERIREGLGGPATDESAAETQQRRLALAYELSSAGIADASTFGAPMLEGISTSLETNIVGPDPNGALAQAILVWGPRLAADADAKSRSEYREALENSPWCPSPVRECGILAAAAAIKQKDGEDRNPYSAEAVAELVRVHGAGFAPGLTVFLAILADSRAEIATAISPVVGRKLPSDVGKALSARADRWSERERAAFIAPFISEAFRVRPSNSFLAAAHYSASDKDAIVDALVDLYSKAGNPKERKAVLTLWRALGPTDDAVRRRLINDIAIPMAHQGKGALDLVVSNLDLALPAPRGTVQNLRNTLRDRAKGKDQEKRVDVALLDAGLIKKSGWRGRGRKDV